MKRLAVTVLALIAGVAALGLTGCTFNPIAGPLYVFKCSGNVYLYGHSSPGSPPTHEVEYEPFESTYHYLTNWVKLQPSASLYSDRGWVARQVPSVLKGTWVIPLPYADRTRTKADYLWLGNGSAVDRVWIAFDERATSVPNWLAKDFQPVSPEAFVVSSQTVNSGHGVHHVRYRVWVPKVGHISYLSSQHNLDGNNGDGVVWQGGSVGAQYLLIVRLHPQPDTSTRLRKLATISLKELAAEKGPSAWSQWAWDGELTKALRTWLAKPANAGYRKAYFDGLIGIEGSASSCSRVEEWTGSSSRALKAPGDETTEPTLLASWVESSRGEVSHAASTATVTVTGHPAVTTHLSGWVEFEIVDGNRAEVDNISLWADDVTLGDGTPVTEVTVTQMRPFTAVCADGLPHDPGRLCSRYEISTAPDERMLAGVVLKIDGHELVGTMVNTQPLALDVDLTTMTFSFGGGPLTASFPVEDDTYTADISLSLTGPFTNLAPVASIAETPLEWECGDGGVAQVTLDASASTDELDPTDIAEYRWYEDRGFLSERFLGHGSTLTVPLSWGVHDLTLEVADVNGSVSTLDFQVDVKDSGIDSVQPPQDVWVQTTDPAGTPANLGVATASDICSGHVDITNDAPTSGLFPEGFTPVTWTFDDLRGNVVQHVQGVFVVPAAFFPPPVSEVELSAHRIEPGQPLAITHHCWPQGRGMLVDAWVLIRSASGSVWSVDSTGALVPDPVAWAEGLSAGASPLSVTVHSGPLGSSLDGPGLYTVEAILTVPGGDPLDRSQIIGWDAATLEIEP